MFKHGKMNRRKCLHSLGILSGGLLASPFFIAKSANAKLESDLEKSQLTLPLMGTLVSITILDKSRDKACQAQTKAFARMRELISIFDRHDSSSQLSFLNQNKILKDVHPELLAVLRNSDKYYTLSQGSFDITILPILKHNQKLYSSSSRPAEDSVNFKNLPDYGMDQIQCSNKGIRFLKQDMQISLDGIAKGYIVDQAIYCLKEQGIDYAMVEAGGDIRTIGRQSKHKTWKIGISDPWNKEQSAQVIELTNAAVATSGNYEKYFDPLRQHHHLIDKKTKDSPGHTVSCTVVAPTAIEADALSTALFIKPPQQSLALSNSLPNIATGLITPQGKFYCSKKWNRLTSRS